MSKDQSYRLHKLATLRIDSARGYTRNALTLCENAQRQIDRGLWSIADDFWGAVSQEKFIEEGVPGQKLTDFDGHRLFLPSDPKYSPE